MNILALDTATEACSVSLLRADKEIFAEFELAPRQHNQLLPEMLDKVIRAAGIERRDIHYCAFTNGPGAFTGIRIGAAQAQGIALALGISLVPVSTLAVLAQRRFDESSDASVIAAIDARMNEVYWGQYLRDADNLATLQGIEQLTSVNEVVSTEGAASIVGSGAALLDTPNRNTALVRIEGYLPMAVSMLGLAQRAINQSAVYPAATAPINYLRNQVAEKPGSR